MEFALQFTTIKLGNRLQAKILVGNSIFRVSDKNALCLFCSSHLQQPQSNMCFNPFSLVMTRLRASKEAQGHELSILTKRGKKVTQPTSLLFTKVPGEIRNKIYELAFAAPDKPWDSSILAPLLTCKQMWVEAHQLAYGNLYHKLDYVKNVSKRYAKLRPDTRTLIKNLWLEVDQSCIRRPRMKLKVWKLAEYAAAVPGLPVTDLYLGVRCCKCAMPFWHIKRVTRGDAEAYVPGELLIAEQILGVIKIWPTLTNIRIGLNDEYFSGNNGVRPDQLIKGLRSYGESVSGSMASFFQFEAKPEVFGEDWLQWGSMFHTWVPEAHPWNWMKIKGRVGTEWQGREVNIEIVECEMCCLEKEGVLGGH